MLSALKKILILIVPQLRHSFLSLHRKVLDSGSNSNRFFPKLEASVFEASTCCCFESFSLFSSGIDSIVPDFAANRRPDVRIPVALVTLLLKPHWLNQFKGSQRKFWLENSLLTNTAAFQSALCNTTQYADSVEHTLEVIQGRTQILKLTKAALSLNRLFKRPRP